VTSSSGLPTPAPAAAAPAAALSTMWAVQPRFERDLGAFFARAAELGFTGVEINHSMDAAQAGAILAQRLLPVVAVHAPAPLERHPSAGWNRSLDLAAEDEAERALAVRYTERSIDLAAEAGARIVVVHLGAVAGGQIRAERALRRLVERGETAGEEWEAAADEAVRERAQRAPAALERARRSLAELARPAGERGVTLGLECRLHYHEIPLPAEAAELLAEHPPEAVGYVHDVGHAEVQHRLGLTDRGAWFDLLGERTVESHISDVRGLLDHRAPGNGDVDFGWLAERLPASAVRTLEINQHEPDDDLARGLALLAEAGVVAPPGAAAPTA
jgi:sugar phosphate isomerase/epimerase